MENGALCVTITGTLLMLRWSVTSWDFQGQVGDRCPVTNKCSKYNYKAGCPMCIYVLSYDAYELYIVYGLILYAIGAVTFRLAHFGEGSGNIWIDESACTGEEQALLDCPANPIGESNCDHSEDAGVRCIRGIAS